jgi:AcrR family transcriptional regulator
MGRDQAILQAAEELFYEKGFAAVGVDEIGKRAGLSGSGIYRHFASKDEILGLLFDRAADLLLMSLGRPRSDYHEELRVLIDAHVDFAFEHQKLAVIWALDLRALTGAYRRSFRERQRLYADRWIAAVDACYPGHSHDELVTAVRAIWALLMSDNWRPEMGQRSPQAAELLREIAISGLNALHRVVPATDEAD